jgi:hypothetical protein
VIAGAAGTRHSTPSWQPPSRATSTRTLAALRGYELGVARLVVAGDTVVAELSETVDLSAGRQRTDEAIVFDLAPDGLIRRVGVFLRRSVHV